jgi:hypothetical protein
VISTFKFFLFFVLVFILVVNLWIFLYIVICIVVKFLVIVHSCNPSSVEQNLIGSVLDLEASWHAVELSEAMHHLDNSRRDNSRG